MRRMASLVARMVSGARSAIDSASSPTTASIRAALHYRDRTGRGQHVDTSLLEAGIALSVWEATEYFSAESIPAPLGSAHRMLAPYQAIRCADGYITIGAGTNRLFQGLCDALGHPEWTTRPEFADATGRVRHRAELIAGIEALAVGLPCAEWLARFTAAGVPCGRINNYAEAFAIRRSGRDRWSSTSRIPRSGRCVPLRSPIKMSETPPGSIAARPCSESDMRSCSRRAAAPPRSRRLLGAALM